MNWINEFIVIEGIITAQLMIIVLCTIALIKSGRLNK